MFKKIHSIVLVFVAVSSFLIAESKYETNDIESTQYSKDVEEDIVIRIALYAKNALGLPTLHCAVQNGDMQATKTLLNSGMNVNLRSSPQTENGNNNDGYTPLEIAVDTGYAELASLLLDYGADPHSIRGTNSKSTGRKHDFGSYSIGISSISVAISKKRYDILRVFVAHEIDFNRDCYINLHGQDKATGFNSALLSGNNEIIAIILGM